MLHFLDMDEKMPEYIFLNKVIAEAEAKAKLEKQTTCKQCGKDFPADYGGLLCPLCDEINAERIELMREAKAETYCPHCDELYEECECEHACS